ncbi:transposase [PVC group bacterium]|nr:transposase [PVC group bacterium]
MSVVLVPICRPLRGLLDTVRYTVSHGCAALAVGYYLSPFGLAARRKERRNMGHTFTNHLYHITFSTKGRRCYIKPAMRDRLFQYMCGTARKKKGTILKVNAVEDHLHMLARIAPDIAVSKFVGDVKANGSKWVSDTFPRSVHSPGRRAMPPSR